MKRFALAGNPNCGKTTLFNGLTGSTAHVGNWPGVTVDKREGVYKKASEPIAIVDLPGIYSLSPYTPEEVISRNYILDEKPDCVINIVDATNLERNLYLTTQILEMDVPMVIALNMMDEVEKQGDKIDEKTLEQRLGVPVVKISAINGTNVKVLMNRALEASLSPRSGKTVLENCEIAHLIGDVKIALSGQGIDNPLFHAVKLVENDEIEVAMHKDTVKMVDEFKETFNNKLFGTDFEALVADARYKYISKNYSPVLTKKQKDVKLSKSDKIDRVLTNKWAGIPIFLAILFVIYHLTFSENLFWLGDIFSFPSLEDAGLINAEGEPLNFGVSLLACLYDGVIYSPGVILTNILNLFTEGIAGWIGSGIESLGASEWVVGLVNEGILGGVCAVLGFVPQIVLLLLLISILEDSGYMARVAFILDRIFRKFGISGRAFIPMIMGFGCSVPAIVNTRTLADERERTLTVRTIPFFSCGAKLPILTAVAGAVAAITGGMDASIVAFLMYVTGMALAVVSILLMRSTTQRGEIAPFIMELPAYHTPSFKSLMIHLWDKVKHYVKKVFTIILATCVLIWFLSNFRWDWTMVSVIDGVPQIQESILASLGQFVQPIFTPLGFGSQLTNYGWVFVVAAITGLIAKENVIGTFGSLAAIIGMSALAGMDSEVGSAYIMATATGITWPALISFIIFNMTTIPCFAAVATAKGEIAKGKFKWTLLFWIVASYLTSAASYAVLTMFAEWSLWSILTSAAIAITVVSAVCIIVRYNKKHPIKGA